MSGRLVILPHKSWNVWNQDNREKVARDERLHREAEDAKAVKDKQLLQEQNLELLRDGEEAIKLEPGGSNNKGHIEPFRLFEDLEKQHHARLGNEDYLKEKAQKELLQKKRDGIADWALGEGSVENSKIRPWYETVGLEGSVPSTTGPRLGREIHRKEQADPMGSILKPNTHEYEPKPRNEQTKSSGPTDLSFLESAGAKLDFIESKENDSSDSEPSRSKEKKKKRHKGHKEDRKSKKHSKRKHSDSSDDERSHKKDRKSSRHHIDVKVKTEGHKPADDPWAELRTKRLEREAIERKRAAVLLATVDVYGPGGSGSSAAQQGYGQQYHPHLARHKR